MCSLRLRGPSEASIAMEHERGSVQQPSLAQIKEESRRVLTTISIVGVCYFAVSGGPIGSEYIVSGMHTAQLRVRYCCSLID